MICVGLAWLRVGCVLLVYGVVICFGAGLFAGDLVCLLWVCYCCLRSVWLCCGVYLLCLIAMSDGWFGSLIVT